MKNKSFNMRVVKRIMITKGFGHFNAEEVLWEFPNRPEVYYSKESPRFAKDSQSQDLKVIALVDYGPYLEDKLIWIQPKEHYKSPLLNNYSRNAVKGPRKKVAKVIEQATPSLEPVKPKRPRKVAPVKIVY